MSSLSLCWENVTTTKGEVSSNSRIVETLLEKLEKKKKKNSKQSVVTDLAGTQHAEKILRDTEILKKGL